MKLFLLLVAVLLVSCTSDKTQTVEAKSSLIENEDFVQVGQNPQYYQQSVAPQDAE